jgi:hypothetical protein
VAVTVRLANWNVQDLGPIKSGLNRNNYDVVNAIATLVLNHQADLFVLLELDATDPIRVRNICNIMRRTLAGGAAAMGRPNDFATCVLSPITAGESYAFFIRDNWALVPLPIAGPVAGGAVPTLIGQGGVAITAAEFAPLTNPDGVAAPWFPLIVPDVPLQAAGPAAGRVPQWPRRQPVFAPFWVRGASAPNRVLPIIACHFEGKSSLAWRQLNQMSYFSFLRGLSSPRQPQPGAPNPPVALRVKPPGQAAYTPHTPDYGLLLGDFNVDYPTQQRRYTALTGNAPTQLGMTVVNQLTESLLVTLAGFQQPPMQSTDDLYVRVYDNFLTSNRPGIAAPTAALFQGRANHAREVQDRELRLRPTLAYHAQRGKRGVTGTVLQQLTAPGPVPPSLGAALVGAHVISDHAPVFLDLTIN